MFSRKRRTGFVVACAALATMAVPAGSVAAVKVNLRVEGAKKTLFDSEVSARPQMLTSNLGSSPGRYPCNVADNGGPGVTSAAPTSALGSAKLNLGLNWYPNFTDFLVESISGEAAEGSNYWSLFLNGKSSDLGGCQVGLKRGDSIVWAVTDGSQSLLILRVSGRASAATARLTATSGATGAPVAGAKVGSRVTGADGRLVVSRPRTKSVTAQATADGYIRSNAVRIAARR